MLGGTHELYRGRRFRLQIMPAMIPRELAGIAPGEPLPGPWTRAEREAAHRIVATLHAVTAELVAAAHLATELPPDAPKRWRWLTTAWK